MTEQVSVIENLHPEITNVQQAIWAVMRNVGYVQKTRATGLNYTYAGEAGLIAALRPWMLEYGLVAHVISYDEIEREVYQTKNGANMNSTTLRMVMRFYHVWSNTSIDVQSVGEGSDGGDKGGNKAATGAYKYALRQTFIVETGDDPDKDPSDAMERASAKREAKKAEKAPALTKNDATKMLRARAMEKNLTDQQLGQALAAAKIKVVDPAIIDKMLEAVDSFAVAIASSN